MDAGASNHQAFQLVSDLLIEQVRGLAIPMVLDLGASSPCVVRIWAGAQSDRIVLIGERYAHILRNHPEMKGHERAIVTTALDPDCVHANNRDPQMAVLYRS